MGVQDTCAYWDNMVMSRACWFMLVQQLAAEGAGGGGLLVV